MNGFESKYLVETVTKGDIKGTALRSDVFFKQQNNSEGKCQMTLYDNYITITDLTNKDSETQQITKIAFSFDVIFEMTLSHPQKKKQNQEVDSLNGIKFQKFGQTHCIFSTDKEILQIWRELLSNTLNQRGFHLLFKPIKKIGKGNFASVYLATRLSDNLKCAVKAFSKEATFSEKDGKLSLINQIEIMRKFSHKNLMKLYGVYQSQNSIYVCLQLLEGGQLYDKIKTKYKFSSQKINIIIKGLLLGAVEMNAVGIMHRDIKPQNILFRKDEDYDCVIADFGLAEDSNKEEYLFVRCGTPGYVAPEVINIKDMKTKIDPICDIFMFGESPFPGKNYQQVLKQNRDCNIWFPLQKAKKVDENTLDLLKKMLKTSPKQRISAVNALRHDYFNDPTEAQFQTTVTSQILTQQPNKNTIHKTSILKQQACNSPIMTTANPFRKLNNQPLEDDNNIKFVMKENVMTGHVESQEIKETDSPSIIDNFKYVKRAKVSKFGLDNKVSVGNKEN